MTTPTLQVPFSTSSYTYNHPTPSIFSIQLFPCAFTTLVFLPWPCMADACGVMVSWVRKALIGLQFDLHLLERWWHLSTSLLSGVRGDPRGSVLATEVCTFCTLPGSLTQPISSLLLANLVVKTPCSSNLLSVPVHDCHQEEHRQWSRGEWHNLQTSTMETAKISLSFGPPALANLPVRLNCM